MQCLLFLIVWMTIKTISYVYWQEFLRVLEGSFHLITYISDTKPSESFCWNVDLRGPFKAHQGIFRSIRAAHWPPSKPHRKKKDLDEMQTSTWDKI